MQLASKLASSFVGSSIRSMGQVNYDWDINLHEVSSFLCCYYGSAHAWPLQTLPDPYPFNSIEVSYPVYVVYKIYGSTINSSPLTESLVHMNRSSMHTSACVIVQFESICLPTLWIVSIVGGFCPYSKRGFHILIIRSIANNLLACWHAWEAWYSETSTCIQIPDHETSTCIQIPDHVQTVAVHHAYLHST